MPWGRLDDNLYDHPKLDSLGKNRLACIGLNTLALSWCNRYLTDGFVPVERVLRLGGTTALASALVSATLWEAVEGGYRIHDFLDYNDSAEDIRRRRVDMRELGKRGGQASGEARRLKRDAEPDARSPVPSRPVPSIPVPSSERNAVDNYDARDAANQRFDRDVAATQRELARMRGEA